MDLSLYLAPGVWLLARAGARVGVEGLERFTTGLPTADTNLHTFCGQISRL